MKKCLKFTIIINILCLIFLFQIGCGNATDKTASSNSQIKYKQMITFIDLGSVRCIACKMMEPLMEKIREKYKGKVKVIFYDVWTEAGKPFAYKYKIKVIPTQIILDKSGKEVFRHQGYLPFEEVEKIFAKIENGN